MGIKLVKIPILEMPKKRTEYVYNIKAILDANIPNTATYKKLLFQMPISLNASKSNIRNRIPNAKDENIFCHNTMVNTLYMRVILLRITEYDNAENTAKNNSKKPTN